MHRPNDPAFSLRRKLSFNADDIVDDSDDDYRDHPPEWTPRAILSGISPRRFRNYSIMVVVVLALFWLTRRSQQPRGTSPYLRYDVIDWSQYAYSQYVTDSSYLCNAVMVFEALDRLGSRADRILFYPEEWDTEVHHSKDRDSQLLVLARDKYKVTLEPIKPESINTESKDPHSWDFSITKLWAFRETQYRRILQIDSDVTIFQNLDELFFLPSAPVAMPRAYWDYPENHKLTSLLILLEPAYREYKALMEAARPLQLNQAVTNTTPGHEMYDMELLNDRYGHSALILPHRQYGLVTGEFRKKDHRNFLGNDVEQWNPDRILSEAKLIHFSDWPLPKPWVMWPQGQLAKMLPKCDVMPDTPQEDGCRDRQVWRDLYEDFRLRRRDICKLLSYPAPDWPPREQEEAKSQPEPQSEAQTN